MEVFLTVIHIVVALFMILAVLVQGGNQGGIGAAFGGGSSSGSVFGATGATSVLGKLTYVAAAVFMLTSISLTILQGDAGEIGLKEKLKSQSGETSSPTLPLNSGSEDKKKGGGKASGGGESAPKAEGASMSSGGSGEAREEKSPSPEN